MGAPNAKCALKARDAVCLDRREANIVAKEPLHATHTQSDVTRQSADRERLAMLGDGGHQPRESTIKCSCTDVMTLERGDEYLLLTQLRARLGGCRQVADEHWRDIVERR
jgi:hypothetical protein